MASNLGGEFLARNEEQDENHSNKNCEEHSDSTLIKEVRRNEETKSLKEQLVSLEQELHDTRQRSTERLIHIESLVREIQCLRLFLQTSISDQCRIIHGLYSEGIIKSQLVFQAMQLINITDFDSNVSQTSLTEDASVEDPHSVLRDYAVQLESLTTHVTKGSNILVLIKGFPGAMLLFLASMVATIDQQETSLLSLPSLSNISQKKGCVIGKTSRSDAQVLMNKYSFLIETGILKINIFSDSSDMKKGYPRCGPYDVILVPAIGWTEGLKTQLKTNGLFINPLEKDVKLEKNSLGNLVSI
jgi:hypothetical protein